MKIIKLNEQDLNNLVKKIIKEGRKSPIINPDVLRRAEERSKAKSQERFHRDLMDLLDDYPDLDPSQILEVLQNQVSVYRAEVDRMKRGIGPISADDVVKNFQKDYMADSDEFQWAEDKGGYIITGESGMNRDILYFVNDEDGITACNKDVSKRPDDLEKEKIFFDRKSAEKYKNNLRNWRDDVRWYIESK